MWHDAFEHNGFVVLPDILEIPRRNALVEALSTKCLGSSRNEAVFGVRNLLQSVPLVRALAQSEIIRSLVRAVLGEPCFAVRGLLFDKTAAANWKVPWHQDLSIALRERREVAGFGPWSQKAGVVHVQPPTSVLERMVAVRVHLDDCSVHNGPLRVIPGSHRWGRLSPGQVQQCRQEHTALECVVKAGGVILMRPLLLHASSAAREPGHRRVIHIEYASIELPAGLQWHVQY